MAAWVVENKGGPRRVVVTKDLPGTRWREILAAAGCEVHVCRSRETLEAAEVERAIGERCDGAIGQLTEAWDAGLFEALRRAGGRVYSNYAVGFDNVKVAEATARGIAVGNTPLVLTETTAEMAVALTFAAARRVTEAEEHLRSGKFQGWLPDLFLGKRLHGSTLGVVGVGRIGEAYARMMAPAHHMDLLYFDERRNLELESFFKEVSPVMARRSRRAIACTMAESLDDLLERADVVSIHVPLLPATRHLINRERLARMKPNAVLVNTSRGPVIDEGALVEHLKAHPDFRAGLDVFENEPRLAPGLTDCRNAVIVPHIASATVWTREGMATLAASNVAGILMGFPVAKKLQVEEFLAGPIPRKAASILNAAELGLGVE
ncbi:MAG TPA: NAD(P)-dependent oxidoreductase [Planctomycetota bacterium]|nr:NAD(P)-dependent oxidoreductase [Planctomycetota bacterium]